MARTLAVDEKPLDWIGSSKRDFLAFPERVKDDMGKCVGRRAIRRQASRCQALEGPGSAQQDYEARYGKAKG